MNHSAVILAGGKSSRMGRDKAFLQRAGEPLLARQIRLAREAGAEEIFISGRGNVDYSEFGCRVLQDRFADAGPLAGIERALAESATDFILVLAVDLPEMSAAFLQTLLAECREGIGAVPGVAGRLEPLAAVYPRRAHPLAAALLEKNTRAARHFAEQSVRRRLVRVLDREAVDDRLFANWNRPTDWASGRVDDPDAPSGQRCLTKPECRCSDGR
ncbi:MAG TPA: molybdenum cofactor guanylyltransferase [Verrucomicrobiae bacterium]|nr:molybdenum cofactor guanylyltransferase [Verrucomicrobiae bacterium]